MISSIQVVFRVFWVSKAAKKFNRGNVEAWKRGSVEALSTFLLLPTKNQNRRLHILLKR